MKGATAISSYKITFYGIKWVFIIENPGNLHLKQLNFVKNKLYFPLLLVRIPRGFHVHLGFALKN